MKNFEDYVCPFCSGNSFSKSTWSLSSSEVEALECNECFAGAPLSAWEMLYPRPITLNEWHEEQIDLVEVCNAK